jgi:phage-related protein
MATVRELITLLGFKLDDAPIKRYDKEIASTKEKTNVLTKATNGMGTAFKFIGTAIAAAGIGALGKSIMETVGQTEQYRVALGAMIGDQEKANQIIHDLDYSPVSDFYGTAAAIGGLQSMVTFGMQAEEASNILTRLGDIAQGNGEAFASLSANIGQVFAKGKADATDLKQFVAQGFDVVGEVAKATGKSRSEIERAGVTYEQTAAALTALTSAGGKYNNMLAKQMNTLPGLIMQFKSWGAAMKEAIGSNVLDKLKGILQYILSLRESLDGALVSAGTKAFGAILHGIAESIIWVTMLKFDIEDLGLSFQPIADIAQNVFGFIAYLIQSIRPNIANISGLIITAFKPLQAFVEPVLEALKPLFKDVFDSAAEIIGQLIPIVDSLTPTFRNVGDAASVLIDKVRPIFNNIRKAILAIFEPIETFVLPIINALKTIAVKVFNTINGALDTIALSTSELADTVHSLTPAFKQAGEFISGVLLNIKNAITAAFEPIRVFATPIIESLKPIVKDVFWYIADVILGVGNSISGLAEKISSLTPVFQNIGKKIADIFEAIRLILQNVVNTAKAAFESIQAFIEPILERIVPLIESAFNFIADIIKGAIVTIGEIIAPIAEKIKELTPAFEAMGEKIGKVINSITVILDNVKEAITAAFEPIKAYIMPVLEGLWSVVTNVFEAIIDALSEVADMFGIVEGETSGLADFIKSLTPIFAFLGNVVKTVFTVAGKVIGTVLKIIIKLIGGIVKIVMNVANAISKIVMTVASDVLNLFVNLITNIKSVWNTTTVFFTRLWDGIVATAEWIWEGLKSWFISLIDSIKAIWTIITGFFSGLWNGILLIAFDIWNGIIGIFSSIIENIKGVWNGITGFFFGLWESLKNSPVEALEFIKNTFFGLFDNIKNRFFEFINIIQQGWEKVKGFFSGLWDGAVNFFTGSGETAGQSGAQATQPVNDMILTPDGNYSTHPDDYIMAMKNPGSILDTLIRLLSPMKGLQPAYTGASLSGNALSGAVRQAITYDNSRSLSTPSFSAPIQVTVNANGMTPAQAQSVVECGVQNALNNAIASSRGVIPSPEARRL